MALSKKVAYSIAAFIVVTFLISIVNYILQIAFIFLDIITRLESSSAFVIVLWIVTGIFGALLASGAAEAFIGKKHFTHTITGNTVLVISLVAILPASLLLANGHFRHNPSEFSLLLSNGWVFISYFAGAGGMALIIRKMDE